MASNELHAEVDGPPRSIWLLPFAQQGHINPLMQLGKALALRGMHVTVLLPKNTASSSPAMDIPAFSIIGVDDALPSERSRGSNIRDSIESMRNMQAPVADLLGRYCHRVSFIIYDAFMSWAVSVASQHSIPSSCFLTTGATTCTIMYQMPSLIQRGILPFRADDNAPLHTIEVQGIDGAPVLTSQDFPMGMTLSATNFLFQLVVQISESLHNASSILVNTVEELEQEAIAALRAHTPIFPIGPLLLLPGQASRLPINYWPEDDQCLPWLDAQAPRTVLFVSFGSVASVSLSQFQDLALGLEASGQPFLWVVRPDSINARLQEALPDGFLDRTKNKGLIISWGPQLLILSHPSIGGFMTHGGWNSLTENIATGSVPMICWPHVAEQRVNRFLVTSVWKIGLRLHHNEDGSVSKGEIARAVRELFNGPQSTDLRNKSKEVSDIAKKAIAEGGSSHTNFEKLCNLLCA